MSRERRGNYVSPLINGRLEFLHGVKFELVSRNAFRGTQKDLLIGIVVSRKCRSGYVQTESPLWLEERISLSHICKHLNSCHRGAATRQRLCCNQCQSLIDMVNKGNEPDGPQAQELRCLATSSLARNAKVEISSFADSIEFAIEFFGHVSQGKFPEASLENLIGTRQEIHI